MNTLRAEAETAHETNDKLQERIKELEASDLTKSQELESLQRTRDYHEDEIEKLSEALKRSKEELEPANAIANHNEHLQRRIQSLEDEAEETDKSLREINSKCVITVLATISGFLSLSFLVSFADRQTTKTNRLRNADVKVEEYARIVEARESALEDSEKKYDDLHKQFNDLKAELTQLEQSMENI